jgi:agmatine deiminase
MRKVLKVVEHPDLDVALIQLEQPVTDRTPIKVNNNPNINPGINSEAIGWGRLSENGSLTSILQEVSLPLVSNDKCASLYSDKFQTNNHLCAGYEEGKKDACQGDSGVTLVVPIYEKKGKKYYNTAIVINRDGKMVGQYHKIHIPHDPGFYEKEYFEHSTEGYKIFEVDGVKFAVLICYDQWFPEAARMARLNGAEIIFYPTAIGDIIGYKPEGDWHNAWETSMRGHAIANSVHVAAINRVGIEGRVKFFGQSFISDPFGKILKIGSKDKEELLVQKIDLERNVFFAEGWGFLRNRRPDTYKDLVSNKLTKKSKKLQNVAHYEDEKRALGQL